VSAAASSTVALVPQVGTTVVALTNPEADGRGVIFATVTLESTDAAPGPAVRCVAAVNGTPLSSGLVVQAAASMPGTLSTTYDTTVATGDTVSIICTSPAGSVASATAARVTWMKVGS
jgi:hypothetical protein